MHLKIGSLFDGIGGFPLVASWHGINAVWASEIEPAPISITRRHFPNMKHLGDITKLKGAELEPVDILTFGSPCQDLSVAGNRAGMKHKDKGDDETTRSGLFMEAIRIIREMREATDGVYPRIAVWENVPGAFSSNKGKDFHAVLEEICSIADTGISIPERPGKWNRAGLIVGEGYSVAWRQLDAQYWGVPQRRKRIFLVADFGGHGAAEILFKPESMRRHTPEGGRPWKRFAGGIKTGLNPAVARTIPCNGAGYRCPGGARHEENCYVLDKAIAIDSNCQDSRFQVAGDICPTIPEKAGTGGNNGPMFLVAGFSAGQAPKAGGIGYAEEQSPTFRGAASGTNQVPTIVIPINDKATRYKGGGKDRNNDGAGNGLGVGKEGDPAPTITAGDRHAVMCMATGQGNSEITEDISPTLNCNHDQPIIAGLDCRNGRENGDLCGTLQAKANGGFSYNCIHPVRIGLAVRRLTPTEGERLQGYPDGWTAFGADGKPISDTARYKAIGNSVALCCVDYIMSGIADLLSIAAHTQEE